MDKNTMYVLMALIFLTFLLINSNVSSDVVMELPGGIKISGGIIGVIPASIVAYLFYREMKKHSNHGQ